MAEPVSLCVNTFGTGKIPDETISKLVRQHFDLRPYGLINMLNLIQPQYVPALSLASSPIIGFIPLVLQCMCICGFADDFAVHG